MTQGRRVTDHALLPVGAIAACFAALCACATPTLATHYTVDPNGGADFMTIQEALDAWRTIGARETVLVMPGDYDEALSGSYQPYVVGVMGPSVTRTRSAVGFYGSPPTVLEGLTFTNAMSVGGFGNECYFSRCAFLGYVQASGSPSQNVNFDDCDFFGGAQFFDYIAYLEPSNGHPPFRRLRFHGSPVTVGPSGAGSVGLVDCSFEGPASVLVESWGGVGDYLFFLDCHFEHANVGLDLRFGFDVGSSGDVIVSGCTFNDLSEYGLVLHGGNYSDAASIDIAAQFERCGTAIQWVEPGEGTGTASISGTVLASHGDGVIVGSDRQVSFSGLTVDGSGGHGIAIIQEGTSASLPWRAQVSNSTFTNNSGDGVFVEGKGEIGPDSWWWTSQANFSRDTFAHNRGAGLRITGGRWDVNHCVAFSNGGGGFDCKSTLVSGSSLVGNTSVLNRGDGIRVTGPDAPGDSVQLVRNNVSAMNAGAGFRVPQVAFGSLAFNDAWNNYMGQYVGAYSPADSNLAVDPRFCDLGAGLAGLGLQQGSPCGAGGIYGLIGARSEECVNVTAVGPPPAAGPLAFAIRPTVARGSVEFVPPAAGPEGRVEVFDLSGRRLWSAPLGPATGPLRWRGETDHGRARAGLYWVRFTSAGESAARRLVWLM